MDSPSFYEFKRKTSFFFKEQIKTARLAFTDVTPAEILTEEATDGDSITLDCRILGFISRAAFEVDDYWRIVDVLHKRLWKYDKKRWQCSYKALILLERLLTHGPKSVAEDFQYDKDIIWEMGSLKYVDEKGFNWGLSVRNKSERVLKLLQDESYLKEQRETVRKITTGIKGSGSFCQRSSMDPNSKEYPTFASYGRCNSQYNTSQKQEDDANKGYFIKERIQNLREFSNDYRFMPEISSGITNSCLSSRHGYKEDHPFCEDRQHQIRESLLS
ncbi:ENTH domain-containing protein [Heracleum sosnowskyi]|uniref:ENTH domain-containing protein n=1 Tax=Heracleum sosnowskyi TaxID=360622 RepID=A0AAD8I2Q8_9APIA|nr:ENTH domain-containing protein [Heracleum sosnowskyi]